MNLAAHSLLASGAAASQSSMRWENLLFIALIVAGVVVLLLLLRWALQVSKLVFFIALFLTLSLWGLHTLYYRTEPEWLTPVFDVLAEFFPTKDYMQPDPAGKVGK